MERLLDFEFYYFRVYEFLKFVYYVIKIIVEYEIVLVVLEDYIKRGKCVLVGFLVVLFVIYLM